MKSGKIRILLGMAVALLLPLSFYFVARILKKDRIHLPSYYLPERVDSQLVNGKMVYDTIFHRLNDLVLCNQLGDTVSINRDLEGKILVLHFFFTACPSTCPRLMSNMALLQHAFKEDPKKEFKMARTIQFISITVDPRTDSPAVLRAYAEQYGVDHDRWWLLTGDKSVIYNYAREELRLIAHPGDGGAEDFIHSEKMVLIDTSRYVRGYYNGLDSAALKKCADDAVLLTMEKKKK